MVTDNFGNPATTLSQTIPAYGQVHIDMGAILPAGASGVAQVCNDTTPVLAESYFYYRGADGCTISTANAVAARDGECSNHATNYNTFFGQTNWLRLITNGECLVDSVVNVYDLNGNLLACLLYTSPSPRDATLSRMPSSA